MQLTYDKEKRKKLYYKLGLIISIIGFSIFHIYDFYYYPEITLKIVIRTVFIVYCIILLILINYIPKRYIHIFDFLIFIPCCLIISFQCFISDGFANYNFAGLVMIIFIASILIEVKPLRFSVMLIISCGMHFFILSFHPDFSVKGFLAHLLYISLSAIIGFILNYLVNQMRQREIQNLKEKEVLLKEIHHRVKNNLQLINSLLNLQSGSITDIETKTALIDSQNRVKSMALIHQLLYQSELNTRINISKYLEELMESLNNSYGFKNKHIHYVIRAESIEFDIEKAIPLGLITNELATNAIKYAFDDGAGGKIEISLNQTSENRYMLQVKDNGTGIPEKFNHEKSNTLGINLVKLLAKQLEGKVEFESNGGTTITISFYDNGKP